MRTSDAGAHHDNSTGSNRRQAALAKVMSAASDLLRENHSIWDVTLTDIAKRAGMSLPTLTQSYFPTREAVVQAVTASALDQYTGSMDLRLRKSDTFATFVARLVGMTPQGETASPPGVLDMWIASGHVLRAAMAVGASGRPEDAQWWEETLYFWVDALGRAAQEEGEVGAIPQKAPAEAMAVAAGQIRLVFAECNAHLFGDHQQRQQNAHALRGRLIATVRAVYGDLDAPR
ncbi:TetR/AcrR family transcriptional regulator [Nocardiopsis halophila]|uniref:TetR/AcrR family transcriptional regulator n=1 Tax=Nocardiopsis halophila TaxID=141692 RepID=UPI0003496DF0|nr:TetR/AcrR family transcriptional regulator [Nocardiopsis halophila]